MKTYLSLSQDGQLSLQEKLNSDMPLQVEMDTWSYLGDNTALVIAFDERRANSTALEHMKCRISCIDKLTDDKIFEYGGNLSLSETDPNSLWNVAYNSGEFKEFALHLNATPEALNEAIKASQAFNAHKAHKKVSVALALPEDLPPETDIDTMVQSLINILNTQQRPSDIALINMDSNIDLFTAIMMANEKINVPVTAELNPMADPEELLELIDSLHLEYPLLQTIWSPNLCRPSYLQSLRGQSKPCYVLGQLMAMEEFKNREITAEGIAPMSQFVAGESHPFYFKDVKQRPDIMLDDAMIERFAQSNINLVRFVTYDTGTKLVMSDVRSQYNSKDKNSVLDLFTSARCVAYTTNGVMDILKRYMLKRTPDYLQSASNDIQKFLDGCVTEGMLQPAEDLNGKPYEFKLTPDPSNPHERVHVYFARCVVGTVRSVVFDDVVTI